MSARYRCQICDQPTARIATAEHDMGSSLRTASHTRGIGPQVWCPECRSTVQDMPLHRGCEYGGPRRTLGHVACGGCGRDLDPDQLDRIEDIRVGETEDATHRD